MNSVFDVAHYILQRAGDMSAMKLQKLVYYSQAWSLVWDEVPLFDEKIEAWANGPVCRELFDVHQGHYVVSAADVKRLAKGHLTTDQGKTIDAVLKAYGKQTAQWLSDQTHSEQPWKDARKGLSAKARGNRVITHEAMREFYSELA